MNRPNVLFILADDLGWGDVGYHGSYISTPNIDRMVRQGLELDRHYVCPVCTPTRVSLLTGRYPGRFGRHATWPTNDPVLPDGYRTLAGMFRESGYATGLFGKWHLGSAPEFNPHKFGFDYCYGSLAGGVDPYTHRYKEGPFSRTWHRNGELVDEQGHATDLITDEAARWIKSRTQSWFCYVPFTAVHQPVQAPESWIDRYANRLDQDDPARARAQELYGAYTSHMDHCIGRLLDAVKCTAGLHDTLIVFASDNGAPLGNCPSKDVQLYPGYHEPLPPAGSNGPLHGAKATLYEGGIRTPAAIYWQGRISPKKCIEPVCIADWMPTFAEMLGTPADSRWDGRSVWQMLHGGTGPEREIHWNILHREFAVIRDDWKLIYRTGKEPCCELFNLADDPFEQNECSQKHPELVAELRKSIEENHKLDDSEKRIPSPGKPSQSADEDP
ncbi:MAG TPA: hypothetical protein DCZ94_15620 [Lentisphaeria bacterium]|nr:MAG: hypothetical protein A2X48_16995 [Lentisphaerae bacterium GWF2_49_21]HBC88377.1 hypothetical protein [Lentisphaeria bacterium]